ncbi:response regulator [Thermodesulforhabdus norvegica]|uniref:Response regulator receiver domain-containing protein n=1 Tax=Thermodesulforhabdus norvegica TaxID=39841 RepID=A0A1I4SHF8_9BACT|nr:response regulator [Thermodesulforhabdus norvegica]SFM63844.1 Response regulator receiver domain-containing protein [Thermodesulforhabdus norvegica]
MAERKCRVLIIDDERDFVETLVRRLERRGFEAYGALRGKEGIELLETHDVDVVVLDIRMPEMDGLEVLEIIKRRRPFVEVILLTGHGSLESSLKGLELGAYDYMLKPADLRALIEKIREAHERRLLRMEQK